MIQAQSTTLTTASRLPSPLLQLSMHISVLTFLHRQVKRLQNSATCSTATQTTVAATDNKKFFSLMLHPIPLASGVGCLYYNFAMVYLHYRRLSRLTEQKDKEGNPIPYKLLYVAKNGDVITPDEGEVITTSVNIPNGTRTVQFLGSKQCRTLRDCLFLSVFLNNIEYQIVAN